MSSSSQEITDRGYHCHHLLLGNKGVPMEVAKDANGGGSNQEPEPEGHANKHPGVNK